MLQPGNVHLLSTMCLLLALPIALLIPCLTFCAESGSRIDRKTAKNDRGLAIAEKNK